MEENENKEDVIYDPGSSVNVEENADYNNADNGENPGGDVDNAEDAENPCGDVDNADDAENPCGDVDSADDVENSGGDVDNADDAGNPGDNVDNAEDAENPCGDVDNTDDAENPCGNVVDYDNSDDPAMAEIERMVGEMGAETLLEIIRDNRNAAIRQIISEVEASRPRGVPSGPSVGRNCSSIFDLAALA